jgi:adenosylcobyric acid synthase
MSAAVLMIQGTASSVGKSVIAAGLCRVLRRRGARVAPFKAQNMSLNAAVTADGGEIARSTAVQAAAAGVEPTVDMNPILLKPEAEMRSQVIVRGRVWGRRWAGDYFRQRLELWPVVIESLERLRAAYDVVVAEGAGSPVELNLRAGDLVNMAVARHAEAPVILVGDIDRGGVFAQLIGTLDLLEPDERRLVKGTIVNRFRGDPGLFVDGVRILEERTGRPVFGVVPWVPDLGLAEEDGATLDLGAPVRPWDAETVRIAVLRLPRIANFDDFGPLERTPGIALAYVDRPEALAGADLIVLPGSKSTVDDLEFLRQRGLADAVVAARRSGTPLVGVCGGLQMLGRAIHDPEGVESDRPTVPGLGLLPHETLFAPGKRTARVRARVEATHGPLAGARGCEVDGYEIHAGRSYERTGERASRRTGDGAGRSVPPAGAPLRVVARGGAPADEPDGALSPDGLVFGTYLHGLFENEPVRRALVDWLRARRGMRPPALASAVDPYERWADVLEASLSVTRLLERCGLGRWA